MNQTLFLFFYSLAHVNLTLDGVISFIANQFGFVILILLFLYLFQHEDKKKGVRDLFVVLGAAIAAWVVAHFLKNIFQTLRPFDAHHWVTPLFSESGYAFPSGHATFFMALASSLWFYHKRLALFFGFSALLIGIARIAAGVHYPVDIIGGLVLGLVIGGSTYYLLRMFPK